MKYRDNILYNKRLINFVKRKNFLNILIICNVFFKFDLGVVLADLVFILIAYFSSYRLIQSLKNDPSIFIFGGILMLTYGIISFIKLKKLKNEVSQEKIEIVFQKKNYRALFIKGFLLNFINVGVLLFWFLILITNQECN